LQGGRCRLDLDEVDLREMIQPLLTFINLDDREQSHTGDAPPAPQMQSQAYSHIGHGV